MANTNPARGMRDFLPADIRKRNYVINIIKEVYESYGFEPLETPSAENLETLTGKYGDEGNQLMFKILKRGEKLQSELEPGNIKSENELSDLALRYDLTVPLARVVANYKNDLPKFFKRYQIQPVWRADRPARGRYREFYQCDVDAIGSTSMVVEAELILAFSEILNRLGFYDALIKVNHIQMLHGQLKRAEIPKEMYKSVLSVIDKLDKIGVEGMQREMRELGFEGSNFDILMSFFGYSRDAVMNPHIKLMELEEFFGRSTQKQQEEDKKWTADLGIIADLASNSSTDLRYDPSLARGLSYYTGAIFEVILTEGDFSGSIGGGGRYDGLIGMFGKEQIPAVGFSLGLERILLIMEERGTFDKLIEEGKIKIDSADVMVTIWNEETVSESLKLAGELRAHGLRVLVYPEADKLGKQFKYADSINIPYVCILGDEELKQNKVALKNLKSGEQEIISRDQIASKIST